MSFHNYKTQVCGKKITKYTHTRSIRCYRVQLNELPQLVNSPFSCPRACIHSCSSSVNSCILRLPILHGWSSPPIKKNNLAKRHASHYPFLYRSEIHWPYNFSLLRVRGQAGRYAAVTWNIWMHPGVTASLSPTHVSPRGHSHTKRMVFTQKKTPKQNSREAAKEIRPHVRADLWREYTKLLRN